MSTWRDRRRVVHNAVLVVWGTVLATVTTVTAKIKLLLFLSLGFFLLHQVVSSCCLASSQSQAGSLSARILSAFVFYGFTAQIISLQKVLPRAISAVLCLLMLHHLSAFLWSDPVWCWMWGALTVQSTSGKRQRRRKNPVRFSSLGGGQSTGAQHVIKACAKSSGYLPGVAGIIMFHSHSLPSKGTQVRPLLFFFLCPGCPCAMVVPTDEGLSTAAADGAQSSSYALRSAEAASSPQSPAAGWWTGLSQWDMDAGLHTVLLSWAVCTKKFSFPDSDLQPEALMLEKVNATHGVRKYVVSITLVPVLWLLDYNTGSCHFLKTWNPHAFSASVKFLFF